MKHCLVITWESETKGLTLTEANAGKGHLSMRESVLLHKALANVVRDLADKEAREVITWFEDVRASKR